MQLIRRIKGSEIEAAEGLKLIKVSVSSTAIVYEETSLVETMKKVVYYAVAFHQ